MQLIFKSSRYINSHALPV